MLLKSCPDILDASSPLIFHTRKIDTEATFITAVSFMCQMANGLIFEGQRLSNAA